MKKIITLLFLLTTLCFSQENQTQSQNQSINTDIAVLKTKMEFFEKLDKENKEKMKEIGGLKSEIVELKARTSKGEDDKKESIEIYDKTIDFLKWIIGIITTAIGLVAFFKFLDTRNLKKLKGEQKQEFEDLIETQKEEYTKERKELEERFEIKNKILDKKIKDVEFNSRLGIAVNKNTNQEKVDELEEILKIKWLSNKNKENLYFELSYYALKENADKFYNKYLELKEERTKEKI